MARGALTPTTSAKARPADNLNGRQLLERFISRTRRFLHDDPVAAIADQFKTLAAGNVQAVGFVILAELGRGLVASDFHLEV